MPDSTVGIDVGNSKCVIAVSRDGVVDAVLNEACKRETPSIVQFCTDHRLFGSTCTSLDPKSTINQLKRLFINDNRLLPYETSIEPDGRIVVKVEYRNEKQEFTAAQMLGMLLSHVRRTAEQTLGRSISACVIGIPPYLDDAQRNAYRDAAEIAGLKQLQLLHDGLATAREYGNYHSVSSGTNVVVFVDVGHCDTQVTVVRFTGREFEPLAEISDRDLGGRDFDDAIFQYFKAMFENQYTIDIMSNIKATARLWKVCEKAKLVLSSNKDAEVDIDYLMEGAEYVNGVITRDEFEKMSENLLDRIVGKCREAMEHAGLEIEAVNSVELVGSGSRIPAISNRLTGFFGREMSRTLNGSECVARGCALLCEELLLNPKNHESIGGNKRKLDDYLLKVIEGEKELLNQDEAVKRAKDTRNALEAYIYDYRKKLENLGVKRGDHNDLLGQLNNIEEWLSEEGSDASVDVYDAKIQHVKDMINATGLLSTKEVQNQRSAIHDDYLSDEEKSTGQWVEQSSCLKWIRMPWHFLRHVLRKVKDTCIRFTYSMRKCDEGYDLENQLDSPRDRSSPSATESLLSKSRPKSTDTANGSRKKAKTKSILYWIFPLWILGLLWIIKIFWGMIGR